MINPVTKLFYHGAFLGAFLLSTAACFLAYRRFGDGVLLVLFIVLSLATLLHAALLAVGWSRLPRPTAFGVITAAGMAALSVASIVVTVR